MRSRSLFLAIARDSERGEQTLDPLSRRYTRCNASAPRFTGQQNEPPCPRKRKIAARCIRTLIADASEEEKEEGEEAEEQAAAAEKEED